MKIKHHDHITGKYQGSVHQECNLNLALSKNIPAVFHNLQNYDSHLIFQEAVKYYFEINVIQKQKKNILNNLVKNLEENFFML